MNKSADRELPERPPEVVDQVRFVLKETDWQAFLKRLDGPERDMPGLAEFLARPSVLEDREEAAGGGESKPRDEPGATGR
jgi:hypothetical protein